MQNLFTSSGADLTSCGSDGATDLALTEIYLRRYALRARPIPNLTHFSIDHDKASLIRFAAALALNPSTRVMALPWSPPAWMKTMTTFARQF